jgi:hypothetical protein
VADTADTFAEWAILEIMGHRRLAGHVTEQEIAGRGFLRLDVPSDPPVTQYYSPDSVFAIHPVTEETARAAAALARPAPVSRWELEPSRASVAGEDDGQGEDPYQRGEAPF